MNEPRSLLEYAVLRAGFAKGTRAAKVVVQWAIATQQLGHELGDGDGVTAAVRAYADWWRMSERTAWRDLARFHAAFDQHRDPTPARLAGALLDEMDRRRETDANRAVTTLRLAL